MTQNSIVKRLTNVTFIRLQSHTYIHTHTHTYTYIHVHTDPSWRPLIYSQGVTEVSGYLPNAKWYDYHTVSQSPLCLSLHASLHVSLTYPRLKRRWRVGVSASSGAHGWGTHMWTDPLCSLCRLRRWGRELRLWGCTPHWTTSTCTWEAVTSSPGRNLRTTPSTGELMEAWAQCIFLLWEDRLDFQSMNMKNVSRV